MASRLTGPPAARAPARLVKGTCRVTLNNCAFGNNHAGITRNRVSPRVATGTNCCETLVRRETTTTGVSGHLRTGCANVLKRAPRDASRHRASCATVCGPGGIILRRGAKRTEVTAIVAAVDVNAQPPRHRTLRISAGPLVFTSL